MANTGTSLAFVAGIAPAMQRTNQALDRTIQNFQVLQQSLTQSIHMAQLQQVSNNVVNINMNLTRVTNEIEQAAANQDDLTQSMESTNKVAAFLQGAMSRMTSSVDLQKVVELSDAMTRVKAKLDLVKDAGQSVSQVQNKIYEAAQRSGTEYMAMSDSVAQLGLAAGDTFQGAEEMISFAETFQKMMAISGPSPGEAQSAMDQVTGSMKAGSMQGSEYSELTTSAPVLAQAMADYVGVGQEEMMRLADQGVITSDVIKNAMFMATGSVEAQFGELPKTWQQIWTMVSNGFLLAVQPLLSVVSFIASNWSTLEPIVWGVVAAVGAYVIAMQAMALWSTLSAAIAAGHGIILAAQSIGYMLLALATGNAASAQVALNAAMAASPVGFILIIIGLIVAAIVKWVQSVGGLQVAWVMVTNGIVQAAEFMKLQVLSILENIVNGGVDLINKLIDQINKIPGMDIKTEFERVDFTSGARSQYAQNQRNRDLKLAEAKKNAQAAKPGYDLFSQPTSVIPAIPTGLSAGVNTIADNTTQLADSVTSSEEDLKYLLDIAEREVINRFTTAEVRVDMANSFGDIRESADIDGVINRLSEKLEQQLAMTAEGVHV